MRVVCMYCESPLEGDDPLSGQTSHGLCSDCVPRFMEGVGISPQELLDSMDLPVFLLDDDARILAANRPARQIVSVDVSAEAPVFGGIAFDCMHASEPGGCGGTVHCGSCTMRACVNETAATAKPRRSVEAYMDLGDTSGSRAVRFLISTEKTGDHVLLTVHEVCPLEASAQAMAG